MSDTPRQRVRLTPEAAAEASRHIPHVPADKQDQTGKRGPGRPLNSTNKLSRAAIAAASANGELPHMFLLRIMRGEVMSTDVMNPETGQLSKVYQVPDLPMRMDAAKAAAPYFAPKLQAVEFSASLADEELNQLLAIYGAQAGFSLAPVQPGGSQEEEDGTTTTTQAAESGWLPEPADDADDQQ